MEYDIYMTEVLSQDEIAKLLAAINAGEPEETKNSNAEVSKLGALIRKQLNPSPRIRKIKIYDFERPDKFSREQIRTLSFMHDTFARLTTASLSAQLRSMVQVRVASVDQLLYDEFVRSIPTPTTLAIINMDPLQGNAVIEIDPEPTFSIIDRLLGGIGDGTKFQHELTDPETSIMEGIVVRLLGNLREAWAGVIDLRSRLDQIDTNPYFAQIAPPTEMGALVTLETKIGEVEGMINIFYPYLTLEPIIGKLSTCFWYSTIRRRIYNPAYENYINNNIPVILIAELLTREYSIKEIADWKNGTFLLPLRPGIPDLCYLRLGNRRVWQCEILPDQNWFQKQIKITGYAERPSLMEGIKMEINQGKESVMDALLASKVKVTVELGSTSMTMKEVLSIGEESIFELDKLAGEPVDIIANGVLIGRGETVVIDEYFGVRVTEINETPLQNDKDSDLAKEENEDLPGDIKDGSE